MNIGARLLKHAPLGTIIANDAVIADLKEAQRLVDEFRPLDAAFVVPGGDGMTIATYVVPPASSVTATSAQFRCSPAS